MPEITVISAEQLNYEEFVDMQLQAFAEIIRETGVRDLFSAPYYRWKYATPFGCAKIAQVRDNGVLVAANSMYPLRIAWAGGTLPVWQSCDTATHPKARGKGYFMKCLKALKQELKDGDIFFGFPNKNSMPGFIKLGWSHRGDVNTWVRVLPGRRLSAYPKIKEIGEFGEPQDRFNRELLPMGGPLLERTSSYMNWRYRRHPVNSYSAFAWIENGRHEGVLVMRQARITGRDLAIVMEVLALDRRVERQLLRFAAAWARDRGVGITMILNNTTGRTTGLTCGYAPVPMRFLPKRQVLMGDPVGEAAASVWRENWRVQIGDWDGF
jgi:GNAT superfamily N-acetyltransferase